MQMFLTVKAGAGTMILISFAGRVYPLIWCDTNTSSPTSSTYPPSLKVFFYASGKLAQLGKDVGFQCCPFWDGEGHESGRSYLTVRMCACLITWTWSWSMWQRSPCRLSWAVETSVQLCWASDSRPFYMDQDQTRARQGCISGGRVSWLWHEGQNYRNTTIQNTARAV